jgi:S-DNA-T family DNA segregation ATPase FtsK/SpoIIIE
MIHLLDIGPKYALPTGELNCLLGETDEGKPLWMDLAQNPHMIVSGTTGSGKSTALHVIIANLLLYKNVNIYLMDPKNVEFVAYEKFNNVTISYNYDECLNNLEKIYAEMEQRFHLMKMENLTKYHFPYNVIIIDEFANLISQDQSGKFNEYLLNLAQKARAAGIYIILATQRPSIDIINGTIKSNFPARLSCRTASSIDSRIVLGATGAEKLMGNGDAFISSNNFNMTRFQVAYISPQEILKEYMVNKCNKN